MKLTNIGEDHVFAFQSGEEKGFDFFYRQLFPSLCFFANRKLNDKDEAEDIASNAFIKIWKKHAQFNNAHGICAYLYRIVRNDCIRSHAQKRRLTTVQKEVGYLAVVDVNDNIEHDIIRAEFMGELYITLNKLPPQCRKVFKMLYIEGKTVSEIADELNLAVTTIKTQKARGLAVLRKKFIPLLLFFSTLLF